MKLFLFTNKKYDYNTAIYLSLTLDMRKYFIQTFGCQMNQADSEKVNMILLQSGFMKALKWQDADLIIFNTCSVRQK